jgi:hypothetical protein
MEAIGASSLGTLVLKVHLRLVQELLPSRVAMCVPFFEQLAERNLDHLNKNILERLHDHFFLLTSFFIYLLIRIKCV